MDSAKDGFLQMPTLSILPLEQRKEGEHMKKLLFASILAVVMTFTFAGCTGTTTPTTTIVTTAQLQEQLVVLESKLITLENKINAAVQPTEVAAIKADIASLKTQITGITTGVTQTQVNTSINSALALVNASFDALTSRIAALETATPTAVTTDSLSASVASNLLSVLITTNAPEATKGYFELNYVLTGTYDAVGTSINDALIWLSANPVLQLKTGTAEVLPVYELSYITGAWRVMSVTFRTSETNVAAGVSTKTASYLAAPVVAGYWTISFAQSNSAPVSGGW